MFIKPETQKVLDELKIPERWHDSLFTIRHVSGFEIMHPQTVFFIKLWRQPTKWNLIEKFLVWRLASKIKEGFKSPPILHSFFK